MKRLLALSLAMTLTASGAWPGEKPETKDMRKILKLHKPVYTEIGGLATWEVIPTSSLGMQDLDPFLFLNDHGPQEYPPNNDGLPFGPHPHRGFETVTFILEGDLVHRDNTGYESVIGAGGVQWMTAGKGIIHAEVSSETFKEKGGPVAMLQLWVNLPRRLKDAEPGYIGLQATDIPQIVSDEGRVKLNLISGEHADHSGPVKSLTGLWMSSLEINAGGSLHLEVDPSREIFFYLVKGEADVNGTIAGQKTLVQFAPEGRRLFITASEPATILLGHGEPLREPVVARGPFVMNSEAEIRQAWLDYQQGRFGPALPE